MDASSHEVTALLRAWSDGDLGARDRLVPLVYQELRRRAAGHLRRERRVIRCSRRRSSTKPTCG